MTVVIEQARQAKRVLGVLRLSRDTDESTSIERQREQIAAYAKAKGWVVVGWAADVDVSGAVSPFERDQLGAWIRGDHEEYQPFDVFVSAKLDRLTRSLLDFADLVKWCKPNRKDIASVAESIDLTTDSGRLLANILVLFAQFERERIGTRRAEAAAKLAAGGYWGGGSAIPWGRRPVKVGDRWELEEDPDVWKTAVDTVDAVIGGQSVNALAKSLGCDNKGLRDRLRSRNLTGHVEVWRPAEDGDDLTRRRTVKDKETGETSVLVPDVIRDADGMAILREPRITEEKFLQLQNALDGRKIEQVNRFGSLLLFHVAGCAVCDAVMDSNQHVNKVNGKLYQYYRHRDVTKRAKCPAHGQVRAAELDAQFTAELTARFGGRPVIEEIEHPAQDHTAELDRVNADIAAWEEKAVRGESAASVLRILDGLHAKRARLEGMPQTEAWIEYIDTGRDLSDEWEEWGTAERNAYLRRMGVRALCAKGKPPVFDFGKLERGGEIDWNALLEKAGA